MRQMCFFFSSSKVSLAELFPLQQLYRLLILRSRSNKALLRKPLSGVVATRGISVDPELSDSYVPATFCPWSPRFIHSFVYTMQRNFAKYCTNQNSIPWKSVFCDHVTLKLLWLMLFFFFYWQLHLIPYLLLVQGWRVYSTVYHLYSFVVQEPSSGPPTLVTLKVDPDGFFLYWTGGSNLVRHTHTVTHVLTQANTCFFFSLKKGEVVFILWGFLSIKFCTSCHSGSLV